MAEKGTLAEKCVLSFYDVCVYQSDVELLEGQHWINDNLISFAFEYFRHTKFSSQSREIVFISPDIVQLIKFADSATIDSTVVATLDLTSLRLILMPINDNFSTTRPGGTHWSLLAYERTNAGFYHYDSSGSEDNLKAAQHVADHLAGVLRAKDATLIRNSSQSKVHTVRCAKQNNSYDCGIYALIFADLLAQHLADDRDSYVFDHKHQDRLHHVSSAETSNYRLNLSAILKTLKRSGTGRANDDIST